MHLAKVAQYHVPLPELGIRNGHPQSAGQGKTSWEKWHLIDRTLPKGASLALDIGCNNGFFTLRLAARGIYTIGVEPDEDVLRLGQLAALESKASRIAFSPMTVEPTNIELLPQVDVTLLLSVMHRWVRAYGRDTAERMLRTLWNKTRLGLYFETPNPYASDKEASVLSYMGTSAVECEQFIHRMLRSLGAREVTLLGYLPTDFRPSERRHLFFVRR